MPKNYTLTVRMTVNEKNALIERVHNEGYASITEYVREKLELDEY